MDFDSTEALNAADRLPKPPAAPPERGVWRTVLDSAVAGGRSVVGAGAQLYGQIGQFNEQISERYAAQARQLQGPQSRQARGAEQERQAWEEVARSSLDYERSLRPDPLTASTAEQIVYGLGRSLTKAIGATVAGGPVAGAAVFGASEMAGTVDDLTRDGVDKATAMKAGAVAGVASAAGVALPMMGSTLARTAGLYAVGGPGAFVGQQVATQAILERADYGEIAKRYEPFDPVGLTLSTLIPLPFAAWGAAKNVKASRAAKAKGADVAPEVAPMPQEAIDAAMVQNLTILRDVQEAAAVARAAEPAPVAEPAVPRIEPAQPVVEVPAEAAVEPPVPFAEALTAARARIQAMQESGLPFDEQLRAAADAPEVQNLVVGLLEAQSDPRRMAALMRGLSEQTDATPADATANAVQGMRALTEEELTGAVRQNLKPASAVDSIAERGRVLEQEAPDMPVGLTDDGQPITLADSLAEARRVAMEGTDDTLGTLDADLLRVAAECALGAA